MSENKLVHKLVFDIKEAMKGLKDMKANLMGVADKLKLTKKTMKDGQQSITLDTTKMAASLGVLGAVAGGAFGAMIANSPLLGAQIAEMTFQFDLMFMTLGNALAPVLEPIINWIISAVQWFQQLPAPIQTFIGVTIALTVAITALAGIVLILTAVSLPLIAVILLIAAAVAAIIVVWIYWNDILAWFREHMLIGIVILGALTLVFGPIVLAIIAVIAVFKNWGTIIAWLSGIWESFKDMLSGAGSFLGDVIGGISNAISGIIGGFLNLLISGINAFLGGIKSFFDKIKGWRLLPDGIKDKIPSIELLPSFGTGIGKVPFDMVANIHKDEMIIPAGPARQIRSGAGGGGLTLIVQIDSPTIRQDSDIDDLVDMIVDKASRAIVEKLNRTASWS